MKLPNKKFLPACLGLLLSFQASAFADVIPFDEDNWNFIGATKVEDYKGQKALTLAVTNPESPFSYGMAIAKKVAFKNGVIEYDVAFDETRTFAGLQFRLQQDKSYEDFYMRAHQSGNPDANQYMPVYNGAASWQLYTGKAYSTPSAYDFNEWMHVKLVVAGDVADIYFKDMEKPALTVTLRRDEMMGGVALWGLNLGGDVKYANVSVNPMEEMPEIKGTPAPEKKAEAGTVMTWTVSDGFDGKFLDGKTTLTEKDKGNVKYVTLAADASGMTNLAKVQAPTENNDTTFARVVVKSESDQTKKVNFGFSDKVKVYLNNQLMFEGDDTYLTRDYRFLGTVGFYDSLYLPLKKGDNELLFAVGENPQDITGWGIQARFENMDGITLKAK